MALATTTFSDRHTPHALLTPTTNHTSALSSLSPSKSQKSIYMRSLVVPIYKSSCSSQQDVRQNTYQIRHRIIPGSRPAACTYKCDLPNSATLMCEQRSGPISPFIHAFHSQRSGPISPMDKFVLGIRAAVMPFTPSIHAFHLGSKA
jgi:hypothetical protein